MITRRGTPLVKKGDQVEKGDLLVSGLLPIYNDSQEIVGYEKTNASADVWIKYEENIEITIPRSQTVRHYTSKKVHSGLVLFRSSFLSAAKSYGVRSGRIVYWAASMEAF